MARSQNSPKQNYFWFILAEVFSQGCWELKICILFFWKKHSFKGSPVKRALNLETNNIAHRNYSALPYLCTTILSFSSIEKLRMQNTSTNNITKIPNVLIDHKRRLDSWFNPGHLGKTSHKQENGERKFSRRGSSKAQRKMQKAQQMHLSYQIFQHFNKLNPNNIRFLKTG